MRPVEMKSDEVKRDEWYDRYDRPLHGACSTLHHVVQHFDTRDCPPTAIMRCRRGEGTGARRRLKMRDIRVHEIAAESRMRGWKCQKRRQIRHNYAGVDKSERRQRETIRSTRIENWNIREKLLYFKKKNRTDLLMHCGSLKVPCWTQRHAR